MPPFELPADFLDQFRTLRQQVADLAARVARKSTSAGHGVVTFSSSQFSATLTVAHGLPATPTSVTATSNEGSAVNFTTSNFTATTFDVSADCWATTLNTGIDFSWQAST